MKVSTFMTSLCERLGIDALQLSTILDAKRRILRRQVGIMVDSPITEKHGAFIAKMVFFASLGLSCLLGLLVDSVLSGMTLTYTVIMAALGLTFFSDFTSMLLDTTENQVLLPRPISGRTILAARVVHIGYYMSLLSLAFCFAPLVYITYLHGVGAALMFLLSIFLVLLFLMMSIQLLCLFALRFVSVNMIKKVIEYLLIFMTGVFAVGMSVVVANHYVERISYEAFSTISISGSWMYFFPPAWLAGLMDRFILEASDINGILSLLAIIIPVSGILLTLKWLGPRFGDLLTKLDNNDVAQSTTAQSTSAQSTSDSGESNQQSIGERLLNKLTSSVIEREFFTFTNQLMKSDSAFKLRMYPPFGTVIVFLVSFFLNNYFKSIDEILGEGVFFLFVYGAMGVLTIRLGFLQYGEKYAAAWLFDSLPIDRPGEVLSGTMKAYVCRFILPLNLLLIILCCAVWGLPIIFDVLIAGVVTLLVCTWQMGRMSWVFPFSTVFSQRHAKEKMMSGPVVSVALFIVFMIIHAVLRFTLGTSSIIVAFILYSIIAWWSLSRLQNLSWQKLNRGTEQHVKWQNEDKNNASNNTTK